MREQITTEGRDLHISRLHVITLLVLILALSGCASGPSGTTSVSSAPLDPAAPSSIAPGSSSSTTPAAQKLIQFALTINDQGTFDTVNGYYAIMLNRFNLPVEVSNQDKFTDFMAWDGTYLLWYRRQSVPGNDLVFNFVATATLNQNLTFTADRRTLFITFSLSDPTSAFNQFITGNAFTVAAATTDRNGILGRVIDTMGPGPSLDNDALYSYFIDKLLGVTNPTPPEYPSDNLNDWKEHGDLDSSFPYVNFDIESFTVTVH